NPTAEGQDYGIGLSLLDDKLVLKVNRYEVKENQARIEQLGTVGSRIHILEGGRDENATSFLTWAKGVASSRFANEGVTPTPDQLYNAAAEIIQLSPEFLRSSNVTGAVGVGGDRVAKGWEI